MRIAGDTRVGELLTRTGTTPMQVAMHCDVALSTVYRWAAGKGRLPADKAVQLAQLFGVSVPYLMGASEGTEEAA